MNSVIISVGSEVEVEAPYDWRFHDAADELGGTLAPDRGVWRFPRRDEMRVRQLCSEVFSGVGVASHRAVEQRFGTAEHQPAEAQDPPSVSINQRRAELRDRLDTLLDELSDVHTVLQTLKT